METEAWLRFGRQQYSLIEDQNKKTIMKAFKNIFFFLLLAGFPFILNAQNPDLPSEQVDIIKNFEARLGDSERYRLDPELPPLLVH